MRSRITKTVLHVLSLNCAPRFDIDDSGTISDGTELRQLSVNLCMRLQLVMKVDAIQQALGDPLLFLSFQFPHK